MTRIAALAALAVLLFAIGCANFGKLPDDPKVCNLPASWDIDEDIEWTRSLLKSDFLDTSRSTSILANARVSARTLSHVTAERVAQLTTYRTAVPRCGIAPQILSSNHVLGQLILDNAGVRGVRGMLLSRTCWLSRMKDVDVFPVKSSQPAWERRQSLMPAPGDTPSPFCNSIDPELAFDTKAYVDRQLKELNDDLERLRNSPDKGWERFIVNSRTPSQKMVAYEYVPPFIAGVAQYVVDELVKALPAIEKSKVAGAEVVVVYQTDKLFAKVSDRKVLIAAPLLRAAFEDAAQSVATPKVLAFYETLMAGADPARAKERALDLADSVSTDLLLRYRQNIAFVLAHELAHIYADTSDDIKVDCLAVVNLAQTDRRIEIGPDKGILGMVVDDVVKREGELWVDQPIANEGHARQQFDKRVERLKAHAAIGAREGARALRLRCDTSVAAN